MNEVAIENRPHAAIENRPHAQILRSLSKIAEQAIEGVVVTDLDGTIRFVNAAWGRMHGYSNTSDLFGEHINMFHTDEQIRVELRPLLEEARLRGRIAGPIDHVKWDGSIFPTQTKILLLKSPADEHIGFIVLAFDCTDRMDNTVRLRRQSAELDQLTETNEHLAKEISHVKAANEQFENRVEEFEEAQARWHEEVSDMGGRIESQEQKIAEADQVNGQLQQQLEERVHAQEQLQQQMTELDEVKDGLDQRVGELTVEIEGLQVQVAEGERLETQFDELRETSRQAEQKIDELDTANNELQQQIAQQGEAEFQFKAQKAELLIVNQQLQQEVRKHNEVWENTQQEIGELKQRAVQLEERLAEVNKLNDRLVRVSQEPDEAQERLRHKTTALKEFNDDLGQQHATEWVDAKTIMEEILGISKIGFWFLRIRGKIGPKPKMISGILKWELSSIVRWIKWDFCDAGEFRAREKNREQISKKSRGSLLATSSVHEETQKADLFLSSRRADSLARSA